MPVLTRLKFNKAGTLVQIFFDNHFAFSLSPDETLRLGLAKGQAFTQDQLANLINQSQFERLFSRALNFLSYRPRSRKEIKDKLLSLKDISPTIVDSVIDRLEDQNLINDREFAHWFIDQRLAHKPKGPAALTAELLSKGIDRSVIAQVIASKLPDTDSKLNLARQALATKPSLFKLDPETRRRKLTSFLLRRGFSWDIARRLVDEKGDLS